MRKIEMRIGHQLICAGRRYKLVADADLEELPDRNYYEVVSNREATEVLEALVIQPRTTVEQISLFVEARKRLTSDWRPPYLPKGLILLRRISSCQVITASSEPVFTPSQIKQMFEPPKKSLIPELLTDTPAVNYRKGDLAPQLSQALSIPNNEIFTSTHRNAP
jgi:hypothetical protein